MSAPKLKDAIAARLDASPRIVVDWRNAWRWASMRSMALAQGLVLSWAGLPKDWRAAVPHWAFALVVIVTLLMGMVGRVVDQAPKSTDAIGDPP